ncbi:MULTISPECIES: YqiA/YcfP family alpha/beta fold hydrolase [unclassified Corallococcus]|uniref:YqiA/YcfP family alpha/beta fold hydrolase n=1 Tax=unclassified Corallococcus TaxID=2685029 RepID=UPI001A8F5BA6|nr:MULTISPECIES: YqiA/YcfP family alpha/beta fold hydrolase [unclassified Corallococcus]MBN9681014.1 alpha/beta fold hydrolase [Corallococcus sp. NCSPR001]WAS87391.1 alpha/beta fold hydrolase [Corallococcus sp. NCRR]
MNAPPPPTSGPRWLYLHGFASGPLSAKGVWLDAYWAKQGIPLERLNLRVPSLEHLSLHAMLDTVRDALGAPNDRAVLIGSSMGGYVAARTAEQDARVGALVLLAPAFHFVEQLQRRLGPNNWTEWKRTGYLETDDHAEKRRTRVHHGIMEEAALMDAKRGPWPDVRVPTLIIHGRQDDTCDVRYSREWSKGKRHVRLVEVDDGHELTASLELIAKEADAFLTPWRGVEQTRQVFTGG